MPNPVTDGLHVARTLAEAGMLRPSRPDRSLRALAALHRYGPTLPAGWAGAAARYPDEAAIIDEEGTLTFSQVEDRTNALARGFAGHGLNSGDTLAMMCRNHRGFVETSIACAKLGVHVVLLNTGFARPQVTDVLEREGAVALVYDAEFAEAVADVRPSTMSVLAEGVPPSVQPDGPLEGSRELTLGGLRAGRVHTPLPAPAEPGRIIILTSGTTGTPKGANRPTPTSLTPIAALLSAIPLRAREPTLIAAPLFHAWGFAHMLISAALSSTLVLRNRFDPQDTLQTLARTRATALIVVPVMLQRMLEAEDVADDLSALRVIAASGSALPGPLAQRVMDRFGDKLYNLYGSTEVAWASIAGPRDLRDAPGNAGRPPRGTVVKIFGDQDNEVAPGETGRIYVGSELLFEGYTGGEGKDRRGDLMSTGDVGHFDAEGRLFVDGRDDDMIVSGGENVFPAEVEDLLATVPEVREVAVIGVPDEQFGQRLRAVVSLTAGASMTEQQLQDLVRSRLARYKVPREIVFVDELPRTTTGKILKRELSDGD